MGFGDGRRPAVGTAADAPEEEAAAAAADAALDAVATAAAAAALSSAKSLISLPFRAVHFTFRPRHSISNEKLFVTISWTALVAAWQLWRWPEPVATWRL